MGAQSHGLTGGGEYITVSQTQPHSGKRAKNHSSVVVNTHVYVLQYIIISRKKVFRINGI